MKEWIPQTGSVVSAFIASACCIGPLLGVVLGVGGLGAAASLEVYRPYFLGLTFVCLGTAFYFTYGRRRDCEGEEACQTERGSRWQRTLLWIATTVALVFATVPYLLSLFV